jgi:predicted DNA-binding protein (UPF0251 family)
MIGCRRRARCIGFDPIHICFKPCGVRGRGLETIELQADEFEALRLMDFEGLYQEECAERMGISRTTLSRTLAEARRKVADALLHGKRLVIARAPEMSSIGNQAAGMPQSQSAADSATRQREPLPGDRLVRPPGCRGGDRLARTGRRDPASLPGRDNQRCYRL